MSMQNVSRIPSTQVRSSLGDFEAMWRDMAQAAPEVWSIAEEPLPGLYSTWEPRLRLHEEEEAYRLRAELPGMQRDDITVLCQEGVLTIHGEQRVETAPRGRAPRIQHGYRAFTRRFVLAEAVASEAMTVSYTPDGLEVLLPKVTTLVTERVPLLAAS